MARNAIEHELDMPSFHEQQKIEQYNLNRIDTIKQRVVDVFNEELGTAFSI